MAKGIKRLIKIARKNVAQEISSFASRGDHFSAGLSVEGYYGGYRDALDDVLLALNGVIPERRGLWEERESPPR